MINVEAERTVYNMVEKAKLVGYRKAIVDAVHYLNSKGKQDLATDLMVHLTTQITKQEKEKKND